MKKTLLITCLCISTTLAFSQTKTTNKTAPKPSSTTTQPASAKPAGTAPASGSEKISTPAGTTGGSPTINPIDNSKAIALDLMSSLNHSDSRIIDKDQLNNTITMLTNSNNYDEIYNSMRMLIETVPAGAYKSGNVEAGRQIANSFNSDLEFGSFNSLLLKWEMLLNPVCFDAAWKTNEVKWRKQIQVIK